MDVIYSERPSLRRPVLVAAFQGWNDAADAASSALAFVNDALGARSFALIDSQEFFDFTMVRPSIRLDGRSRRVVWPDTVFTAGSVPGSERDLILLSGTEPSFHWKRFSKAILTVLRDAGVELAVTLGALLADVPHSRPVRVSGSSADPELAERLGLAASTYEGPTGVVGVLHQALLHASIPSVSLWAATPAYIQDIPSPKAALELVRRLATLLDTTFDTGGLERRSAEYTEQMDTAVAGRDAEAYVRELEGIWDEHAATEDVTGESIAQELERYLRSLGEDG